MSTRLVRVSMCYPHTPDSTPFGMDRARTQGKSKKAHRIVAAKLTRSCQPSRVQPPHPHPHPHPLSPSEAEVAPPTSSTTQRRRRRLFNPSAVVMDSTLSLLVDSTAVTDGATCTHRDDINKIASTVPSVTVTTVATPAVTSAEGDGVCVTESPSIHPPPVDGVAAAGSDDTPAPAADDVVVVETGHLSDSCQSVGSTRCAHTPTVTRLSSDRAVATPTATDSVPAPPPAALTPSHCSRCSAVNSPLSPVIGAYSTIKRLAARTVNTPNVAAAVAAASPLTLRHRTPSAPQSTSPSPDCTEPQWTTLVSSDDELPAAEPEVAESTQHVPHRRRQSRVGQQSGRAAGDDDSFCSAVDDDLSDASLPYFTPAHRRLRRFRRSCSADSSLTSSGLTCRPTRCRVVVDSDPEHSPGPMTSCPRAADDSERPSETGTPLSSNDPAPLLDTNSAHTSSLEHLTQHLTATLCLSDGETDRSQLLPPHTAAAAAPDLLSSQVIDPVSLSLSDLRAIYGDQPTVAIAELATSNRPGSQGQGFVYDSVDISAAAMFRDLSPNLCSTRLNALSLSPSESAKSRRQSPPAVISGRSSSDSSCTPIDRRADMFSTALADNSTSPPSTPVHRVEPLLQSPLSTLNGSDSSDSPPIPIDCTLQDSSTSVHNIKPSQSTSDIDSSISTPVCRGRPSPSTLSSSASSNSPSTPVRRGKPSPSTLTSSASSNSPSTPVRHRKPSSSTLINCVSSNSPSTPVRRREISPSNLTSSASSSSSPPTPVCRRKRTQLPAAAADEAFGAVATREIGRRSSDLSAADSSLDEIDDFKRRFVTPRVTRPHALLTPSAAPLPPLATFIKNSSDSDSDSGDSDGSDSDSRHTVSLYHRLRPDLTQPVSPPLPTYRQKQDTFIHGSDSSLEAADFQSPKEKNFIPPPSPPRRVINRPAKPRRRRPSLSRPLDGSSVSPIGQQQRHLSFFSSLASHVVAGSVRHPEAARYVGHFRQHKLQLAAHVFRLINQQVFDSQLPADLPIQFNNRLKSTAGYCYNWSAATQTAPDGTRLSRIDLSTKVVDNCERLRDTLVHELCHAVTWVVSGCRSGHGPVWRQWTRRVCQRFPELPAATRCHAYTIAYRFTYTCTGCGYSLGRHSRSLDTRRKVCGRCRGVFQCRRTADINSKSSGCATKAGNGADGDPDGNGRPLNAFAQFVRYNYGAVRRADMKHADVMRALAQQFAAAKISASGSTGVTNSDRPVDPPSPATSTSVATSVTSDHCDSSSPPSVSS